MEVNSNTSQILNYDNISDSEVFNSTALLEEYKIKEYEQYLTYKPVACTFGVLILLSNITVVVSSGLILKKGQQQKSTYLLLGNVSLADTIIGISMLIGFSFHSPTSSSSLCIFEIGMLVCPAMVSIFSVGLIAVDRYIYILHGLYYQRWVNTTKVRISIMFIWIIGLTLGFLPATGWINDDLYSNCYYVAVFPGPLILLNSILSIVPIIVVAVLYSIILVSALRNVRKINASVDQLKSNTKSALRIYRGNGNMRSNTQSLKNSVNNTQKIRHSLSLNSCYEIENGTRNVYDISNKSNSSVDLNIINEDSMHDITINNKRITNNTLNNHMSGNSLCSTSTSTIEENSFTVDKDNTQNTNTKDIRKRKVREATKWRAITIVMLTTGSFVCTWMPFFITVIFYVLCEEKDTNPRCIHIRLLLAGPLAALAFLNSILNPLIYVWWHKGFQRSIQTYLKQHTLYRVAGPSNEFAKLEATLDFLSTTPAASSKSGQLEVLLRLSPEEKEQWLSYFTANNMSYTLVANNLADILRDEESKINNIKAKTRSDNNSSMSCDQYYGYQEINDYLDSLAKQYPDVLTVINAGLSYEGKQIKYVRISSSRFEELYKPVIVIDAAIHAREWVTAPVALYLIHKLVVDVTDKDLVENIDWIIMPMSNPDGYEYSMKEDRMWRKTRSKSHEGGEDCPGVDGNRNFDHYFRTSVNSSNPCSIIYEGPAPFSEPETRIIRDAILTHLDRVRLYITIHSFGNMFLYAWGNNGTLPSNGLILQVAGIQMAQAIDKLKLPTAQSYVVGNAAQVLYYTTGTSRDWTRANGIPLTYTLELPGYDYGFLVPPQYIKQIVTETYAGLAAGARYVLSIYN